MNTGVTGNGIEARMLAVPANPAQRSMRHNNGFNALWVDGHSSWQNYPKYAYWTLLQD